MFVQEPFNVSLTGAMGYWIDSSQLLVSWLIFPQNDYLNLCNNTAWHIAIQSPFSTNNSTVNISIS